MKKTIVVVCESKQCYDKLIEAGKILDIDIKCETQFEEKIVSELSINDINNSVAVLFAVDKSIEEIEKIERFIDFEYYEVEPKHILLDAKSVLNEILTDIN